MKAASGIAAAARPHIPGLRPYVPGSQPDTSGWIKLNTNESPFPPSPRVGPAVAAEIALLPRYPSPTSRPLRTAIAAHHGYRPEQVIVGNGSDDLLNLLTRVFCGGGLRAGMLDPSYSLYPVLTAIEDGTLISVPFDPAEPLPLSDIVECGANLFFLTSPNAPTGLAFPTARLRDLAARFPGILVIDEAYAAFADEDAADLPISFPRTVVLRTFSKSHGLAGLRVGYALAAEETIGLLDRVRDSYNVNRLSQAGALAALGDVDYTRDCIRRIRGTRQRVEDAFRKRGWPVYPSATNFLCVQPRGPTGGVGPGVAGNLFAFLRDRRILVRHFPAVPAISGFIRVSIGTDEEMDAFLEAVDTWIQNEQPN